MQSLDINSLLKIFSIQRITIFCLFPAREIVLSLIDLILS